MTLVLEGVTDTGQNREDGNLSQFRALRDNHVGVVVAIEVVDRDVEDVLCVFAPSRRTLVREMEVRSNIQSVVIGHFEVVALLLVWQVTIVHGVVVRVHSQRPSRTCAIDKGGSNVDLRRYLVLQRDREVVFAVVLGVEWFAEVDFLSRAM